MASTRSRRRRAWYQKLLARMRKDLGAEKIEPWDLEFYFANFTNDFEAQKFPVDEGGRRRRG